MKNPTKLSPRRVLILVASMLMLATLACAAIAPTVSSTSTLAPETPESGIKAGHWEGEPSVSFNVTSEGNIHNFKIVTPFGALAGQSCTIEIDEIVVGEQGEFTVGQPQDSPMYLTGQFSGANHLTGTYKVALCKKGDQYTMVFSPEEKSWSAEWTGSQKASKPPAVASTVAAATHTPVSVPPTRTPMPAVTSPPTATALLPTNTPPPTSPPSTATPSAPTLPAGRWQPGLDLPRQINSLVVDPTNPQVLYAGTGDNGSGSGVFKSEDAGLTWRLAANGLPSEDVTALALSPDNPLLLYAAAGVRGDIYASADGAQSWTLLGDSGMFGMPYRRLVVAPDDGNLLFAVLVAHNLFRSSDGGQTWQPIGEGLPGDENSVNILSLAIDPTAPNVLYAGTGGWVGGGHGVYKSSDRGETWSAANRGLLDYRITAIAVDPALPQTIYAGADAGEFFKSTDGGQSWSDLTDELPVQMSDHPTIREIAINPAAPNTVYLLVDDAGVVVSEDGGGKWRLLGQPGQIDYTSFTAMGIIFEPEPVVMVGIEREGGWRYAAD
jgi:photosystem II stability/assembly factor-like uncharacterized protein